jgi:hypothetical protein
VFWVVSVYFNIRNTLPKSGTFLLGHPVYNVYVNLDLQKVNHYDTPYVAPPFNSNAHFVVYNYNAKYLHSLSRGVHLHGRKNFLKIGRKYDYEGKGPCYGKCDL